MNYSTMALFMSRWVYLNTSTCWYDIDLFTSGYSTPKILQMNEIAGGSPYGATTLAGADGSKCRTPPYMVNVDLKTRDRSLTHGT